MTNTLGIVEVPSAPPAKLDGAGYVASIASRRLGGISLLEWVVRRVSESLLLDQVAVVTDAAQADMVRKLAPADATVFVGSQTDSLGRFAAALRALEATQVVHIPLACPFIDAELIDRLVCTAGGDPACDYIGYFSLDGRPAVASKVGLFAEWCRADAVFTADREAQSPAHRNEATRYVYSHPDRFHLRFIPIPSKLDRPDVRLTVDVEEDWELAHLILDALGPDEFDWYKIASLLDHQPALRERMADLNETHVS